jgi:pumilio family protein 6
MAATKRSVESAETNPPKKVKTSRGNTKTGRASSGKTESVDQGLAGVDDAETTDAVETAGKSQKEKYRPAVSRSPKKPESYLNNQSSREAHAKQKALTQDRRAAKPNADSIARSKKIWERLRRKSHVPKPERDELVTELFQIISGRVKDFVFKHDSVRVIQCALKYATPEQRKQITAELKGSYRELAESKYAKFLIAKMVAGDDESRDAVVEEFYGHVKRLIRHPEASWIVDDIYRTIATKQQKAILLREWYGTEFVVFGKSNKRNVASSGDEPVTSDLSDILAQHPEKRAPIMAHLHEMTNQLVQKKTTGFTILHDALLQYFLNCKPGSPEITEFFSMLHDDEEGDLQKNLAFTKSGSRLLCLCLAHGSSKDRRGIMKFFKTHIKLLAGDQYGHKVLLTAYDVIDDTVMTSKTIFPELLGKDREAGAREEELLAQVEHLTARIPLLYLMSPDPPKWLITEDTAALISEIREIRKETSRKDPEKRRLELLEHIAQPLLDLIQGQTQYLAQSSFGCQFIMETILGCAGVGDAKGALAAIASLATDRPEDSDKKAEVERIISTPPVGRMLKTLVQGGRFDKATNSIKLVEPSLRFHQTLYSKIKATGGDAEIVNWTNGPNSFVVVAMLEAEDFEAREELLKVLKKNSGNLDKDNKGAAIVLAKIGGTASTVGAKEEKKRRAGRTG